MDVKDWLDRLSIELALDRELDPREIDLLLEVARDAAHGVERLAAPLTTFLLGVAVGRGQDLTAAAASATALLEGVAD